MSFFYLCRALCIVRCASNKLLLRSTKYQAPSTFFLKLFLLFTLLSNKAWSLDVVASINPVHQIILAIAGDDHLIIKPSKSEHDYQLKKSDISALIKADLIFYVDDSLETKFPKLIKNFQLEKKSYQLSKINGIKVLQNRKNEKKLDPHLWLDPENGVKIAEFVTQKFCETDEKNCQKYQNNFKKFRQEIFEVEKVIKSDLKGFDVDYAIYHDAYQYFENFFAIKAQKIISNDHNSQLKVSDLRDLESVKCLVGERMDERSAAQKLAKNYQIKFVKLDVIGGDEGYGYLLRKIAQGFVECGK
ncbi:MAG: zinc ABC transporter substrate-binding protein [Proteobacteria bacterium]|nr:zinc ABC transporter substrate-binding protein [Pseudomonadota bacterium]